MAETVIHLDTYNSDAKSLVGAAQSLADERKNSKVEPLHLLSRVLEQPELNAIFKKIGADPKSLSNMVDVAISKLDKTSGSPAFLSSQMLELLGRAEKDTNGGTVGIDNLLNALAGEISGAAGKILQQFEIVPGVFRPHTSSLKQITIIKSSNSFTRDLVELAATGKFGTLIGRDEEVRRLLQILSRSSKNNPLVVGVAGSGKSAIVEEIAKRFSNKEVPPNLAKTALVELEIPALTSGIKSRTEIEERITQVLNGFKKNDKSAILVIDGVENLFSQTQMMNISDLFKTLLSREEVRVFGLTTQEGLRKMTEKDAAFVRKFTTLEIDTLTVEQAIEVVRGVGARFQKYHGVNVGDPAITAAVNLSKRYIQDKALPDSALDILDEAAARKRLEMTGMPAELDKDVRRLESLKAQYDTLKDDTDAMSLKTSARIKKEIAELEPKVNEATSKLKAKKAALESIEKLRSDYKKYLAERDVAKTNKVWARYGELEDAIIPSIKSKLDQAEAVLADTNGVSISNVVGEQDIAQIIAEWTGIPLQKMLEEETEKLLKMEDRMQLRVVGQDEAVKSLSKAVRRARVGLRDPKKPIGSFLFLGPSGVGKTELAKALAEFLFDDEQAMTRFDMSEFQEKHNATRLIGAPNGYQGSENGGELVNAVKTRPYSVLLFDEIEKAHPDVFNLLLQVLDDGRLTDSRGNTGDFSNTVVILTSNIGSNRLLEAEPTSFESQEGRNQLKEEMLQDMRKFLRPEFINRIDNILMFKPLTKPNLRSIVDLELKKVEKLVADREFKIVLSDDAKDALVEMSYEPRFGARPVKRSIVNNVQNPLAEAILNKGFKDGETIKVKMDGKEFVFDR